ncbi:MAG: phosphoribosylanthranilate isomerase [Eubacteriales bacterium]
MATKIKICGLTDPEEVRYLAENQVDFAGTVLFFPKSKRNIPLSRAKEILAALPDCIKSVAVVVSPTPEQVEVLAGLGYDLIQIHGELSKEVLADCPLPILRAIQVQNGIIPTLENHPKIAGYVIDAATPGSGQNFDWSALQSLHCGKPYLLAGGLHPGNVADAVRKLHPDGVDVSSGVEFSDRLGKDPQKIRDFVSAVREAEP